MKSFRINFCKYFHCVYPYTCDSCVNCCKSSDWTFVFTQEDYIQPSSDEKIFNLPSKYFYTLQNITFSDQNWFSAINFFSMWKKNPSIKNINAEYRRDHNKYWMRDVAMKKYLLASGLLVSVMSLYLYWECRVALGSN